MTLYTSESKEKDKSARWVLLYLGVTVFSLVFFLVYERFSHGVRSPYMTWLFAWPMVFGFLPALVYWRFRVIPRQGRLSANLYHSGVAALTVSSMLRGIFEIAGTYSDYHEWLRYAGWIMVVGGIIAYTINSCQSWRHVL